MRIPRAVFALSLALSFADAQRIRVSREGCLVDKAEQIAAEIRCGNKSTVAFAVEWHGADVEELQTWLEIAGCREDEAKAEAVWAAEHCQVPSELKLEQDSKTINSNNIILEL